MNKGKYILVNVCRLVTALTFILSGFVKAIDPLGTQYKLQDYATALHLGGLVPDWLTLATSVGLSAIEFTLGLLLLFAIHRRLTSRVALCFMVLMTLVTVWIAFWEPVKDCGCFGDALPMTGKESLLKNVVLLACISVVARWPLQMVRFISKSNQWIVVNYAILFILAISLWCLYYLPLFDFRPYHIGADLPAGMTVPEGEQPPQYETTFILEKDGEQKEFTLDNYPDSTWTFIDSRTVKVAEGYEPPIHDFSIEERETGDDITDSVLHDPGYTFLLIAPNLAKASDTNFGEIDQLYEYAREHGYPFYCLTASGDDAIERWRDLTGAEYPFCMTDETTLKTIIRSNPGLLLLKGGVVLNKWSHNRLPSIEQEQTTRPLEQTALGRMAQDTAARKIVGILLWFALPLLLLTLADRTWAWTQWLRKKKTPKTTKHKTSSK